MRTYLFLLFISVSIFAFSQEPKESKIALSFSSGPNVSFLRSEFSLFQSDKPLVGNLTTFDVNFSISNFFNLRTGLSFESKGSKTYVSIGLENGTVVGEGWSKTIYNEFGIPILGEFKFGKKHHFFINSGFAFQHIFSRATVVPYQNGKQRFSSSNTGRKFEIGLLNGFGGSFALSKITFFNLEFRNNFGLTQLAKKNSNSFRVTTNSTALMLGLMFKL